MIQWFSKILGKGKKDLSIQVQTLPSTIPQEVQTTEFPKTEYSAYWEVMVTDIPNGFKAEVRILGYSGTIVRDVVGITAPTKEKLQDKINTTIRELMKKYKGI